jgi:hypothetical protein
MHVFLEGVPLHDVWAVDLPRPREPVTLAAFHSRLFQDGHLGRLPAPARALFALRFALGRAFRLEREPANVAATSFAGRLTDEDRARSSTVAGTPDGLFRVVYRFENEALTEVQNRTVHGALGTALVERDDGYRFYMAVYVVKNAWITPLYMALIDPFRRWIIYPAMLKDICKTWLTFA